MKTSKSILITGATGYIGSNLARQMVREGFTVHIVARKTSSYYYLSDIKEKLIIHYYDGSMDSITSAMRESRPEIIFHLASLFLANHKAEDVERLIESNILFGAQILDALDPLSTTKFVNVSTSWEHYNKSDYDPVCLYAATKKAFEDILIYYIHTKNIKTISLELSDSYGPNDNRKKLFYLLNHLQIGSTLKMTPGEQLLDLVFITDIVEAIFHCYELVNDFGDAKHDHYSVSSGAPIRLREVVEQYLAISKKKVSIEWGGIPYREREVMDPRTATLILPGWKPKFTLAEGLSIVWNSYQMSESKGN
jgi:nucleoside-diphosphate-sugar epimerase